MASEAVCEVGNRIVDVINKGVSEHKLSCGDVIELISILNANMADWLSESMKETTPAELLAEFYSFSLDCHKNTHKDDSE